MKRFLIPSLCSALASVGALLIAPQSAQACGGLFCDGGPQPMPVDQTGEDILFIVDTGHVEVHIRILYDGEAQNFAWVIPMQSVPTNFDVGSDAFFEAIKNASVPTYGITVQPDDCQLPDPNEGDFGDSGVSASAGGTGGAGDGGDTDGGGPTIFAMETVGAFEITVLGDGTAAEVMTWLNENGYQQDPDAEPILEEYLAENHVFAAIKLTGNADVDSIHPIVLTFDHEEPCVPLRLTRIAAQEDMEVRTYFLGDERVVPRNYRHVLVNPLQLDWSSQAANYKEVITGAVDAEHADGRAFVTEYAGTSEVIQTAGVFDPNWNAEVFETLAVTQVIDTLENQGLYYCDTEFGGGCTGIHPMIDAILATYLPVPAGLTKDEFYDCLECYADQIDMAVWDPAGFAALVQERIIDPGQHAVDLVGQNPYLTRMYTTISPHEMIEDPMFHANPELEEVPNIRTATQRILCNGDSVWILPDGREIYVPAGDAWPEIPGNPWEAEIHEMPAVGAPVELVNRQAEIDEVLAAYNAQFGWPGGEGGGSGSGTSEGGCGCRADAPQSGALWTLGLGLGLAVARRRRE